MKDKVQIVFRHALIRRVQSLLVVLTRSKREPQLIRHFILRRQGSGLTDWTGGIAHFEAVPIPAIRFQALNLDVHRMAKLWTCKRGAGRHDILHAVRVGDLPENGNRLGLHATRGISRIRSQLGPKNDTRGVRISRSNTQAKRIISQTRPIGT